MKLHLKQGLMIAAGLLAFPTLTQATWAQGTLLIQNIGTDSNSNVVVKFSKGATPLSPKITDIPGEHHYLVVDFENASLDTKTLPVADELSAKLHQALPLVQKVRCSELSDVQKPTVRLLFDLVDASAVSPQVTEVTEGEVAFNLGVGMLPVATTPAPAPGSAGGLPPAQEGGTSFNRSSGTFSASSAPAQEGVSPAPAVVSIPEIAGGAPALPDTPVETSNVTTAGAQSTPDTTNISNATTQPPETPAQAQPSKALQSIKHYNAAVQLHLSGKLPEAIAEYQAALTDNPQLAEARSNLGLIYNQQHNYGQALIEFRKALAINPKDAITYNGIGAALRAQKDLQGAIKNWQAAISLDPHLATAYYNLGTAYEVQKNYDKAMDSYKLAVKNDERLGEAYYRMGLIMERKKKPEDAVAEYQQSLKASETAEYCEDARQRLSFLTKNKVTQQASGGVVK